MAKAGIAKAWEWIADHDEELRRTFMRYKPESVYTGEDALHDAYIYILTRLDLESNPTYYCKQKAHSLIRDYWRKDQSRDKYEQQWRKEAGTVTESIDDIAIASVLLDKTCCAIERLPAQQRLVMWKRMEGYSQAAIAEMTSLPLGTVKTEQRKAMKKLEVVA